MTPFFSDADISEESPCTLIIENDLIYSPYPRSVLCPFNVLLITADQTEEREAGKREFNQEAIS